MKNTIVLLCLGVGGLGCAPPPASVTFPETCIDAQDQAVEETGSRPANGTYTLYVNGDESLPWDAYCNNMNRAEPTEYLTVEEANNFSQVAFGTDVTETTYRRYRIDPIRLEIDPLDDTFAATEGGATIPDGRSHIPAGWAQFGGEEAFEPPQAESKADLTGTSFVFSEDVLADDLAFFCTTSDTPDGDTSTREVSADLTSFSLTAINTDSFGVTKTVADCDNLSGSDTADVEDFTTGAWPLQYAGE